MSDSITERTPPVIAVKINMIKQQTEKVVLNNAIEIGRMNNNLTAAYNKVAANKIAFLYENLDKAFKELAYEMTKFASLDPNVHVAYKKDGE